MNVGVVGAGYVGLVTAAGLASVGHRVVCMDIDHRKVDAVNDGRLFLYEPGLDHLVAQGVRARTLRATTNVRDAVRHAAAAFICVGTPSAADGGIDLRAVRAAVRAIGDALRRVTPCRSLSGTRDQAWLRAATDGKGGSEKGFGGLGLPGEPLALAKLRRVWRGGVSR